VVEVDLHLLGEGRHRRLWEFLGPQITDGSVTFRVWAPNARSAQVIGDWNDWRGGVDVMIPLGSSGVWEVSTPAARPGHHYKFDLEVSHGWVTRSDPMARQCEAPPRTASIVPQPSQHRWSSRSDTTARAERNGGRWSIYELHVGSWRWSDGQPLGYRSMAEPLAEYLGQLGFTHVELLPIATHPFGGSWGYQVTGYYAPDARHGDPDDLRFLIDTLHTAGIGVILDWVPAHFPRDEGALARFDGTALYEHADPRRGEHPDWGTLVFNHGRNEVRNFLVANALYWLEEFRVDGLRVDAVASMLYLDYSRAEGEWIPNAHGGREDLDAVAFLRELNEVVAQEHPGAVVIAEESTAWPGVTAPVSEGGLGFDRKWNLGWMHDTLGYLHRDPIHRRHHHDEMTLPMIYAFDERWVLPLSHDEVVHGKGSLLSKMPGDDWQRFANLRALLAWQWAMPGSPLLFMGGELGEWREWADDRPLDWGLVEHPSHRGVQTLVADLNSLAARHRPLWATDNMAGAHGTAWWLEGGDRDHSVFAFARRDPTTGASVVVVANFTPVPRHGYRVGLPGPGGWTEVLSTDDQRYGGSGVRTGHLTVERYPWQGQEWSAVTVLPPLGVVILAVT
jgi:1,4-alpha-glucan branching enzyme